MCKGQTEEALCAVILLDELDQLGLNLHRLLKSKRLETDKDQLVGVQNRDYLRILLKGGYEYSVFSQIVQRELDAIA